jgi:hypothetical protein
MEKERILKDAKYLLETDYPPVNSLYLLKRIEDILNLGRTNSLTTVPVELKALAIPYIIMLLDHALIFPSKLGFVSFHSPKVITELGDTEPSTLETAIRFSKKILERLEK